MSDPAPAPGAGRAARQELVRAALDPGRARDPERVAAYADRHGIGAEGVLAHLAGRIDAYEVAVDRLLALATHTTPDRQLVLREALDALRAPYERALGEAMGLVTDGA